MVDQDQSKNILDEWKAAMTKQGYQVVESHLEPNQLLTSWLVNMHQDDIMSMIYIASGSKMLPPTAFVALRKG
jgi:hypothetical protein